MNRREFSKTVAGAIGAAGIPAVGATAPAENPGAAAPYQISVMLWTVFKKLPIAPAAGEGRGSRLFECRADRRIQEVVGSRIPAKRRQNGNS